MSGRTVNAEPSAIAIGWSFQAQLDERRILTAQTHVPVDASVEQINATLDKIAYCLDRMQARYRLPLLEKEIKRGSLIRDEAVRQAARVDEQAKARWDPNRRTPFKLSQTEESEKRNFQSTVDRHNMELNDLEKESGECRAMLNGAGA